MRRSILVLAGLALALAAAGPAAATVPTDLCTGNPCTVSGSKTVDAGSVLSFGSADLVFASNAVVTIGPGVNLRLLQIDAKSITMQPGARILGGGDNAMVLLTATDGDLNMQASGATRSRIDLGGNSAGSIGLAASNNSQIDGLVLAHGSGTDAEAGTIAIDARGTLNITTSIDAAGAGPGAGGGEVDLSAANDIGSAGIDASGSDFGGGDVSFTADSGNVVISGNIDVSGGSPDGSAGSVDIEATLGNVNITANIFGTGGTGTESACGDGAELSIDAGGSVTIGGDFNVTSGTQCFGGDISVSSGGDFTMLSTSSFAARGPGSFGGGGSFELGARNATLYGIDLSSPAFGGTFDITATGLVNVLGNLDAGATGSQGIGGVLSIQSCAITIASSALLDARGAFAFPGTGTNTLRAGGQITVAGQVRSTSGNAFQERGLAPAITGTVQPAADISVDPTIPDCVQLPQCGNGVIDPGEACDDGNNLSCDGCSSDCTRVDNVCGDGVRECGEQCDDGNNVDGDGCQANCTLPTAEGVLLPGVTLPTAGCLAEWKLFLASPAINPTTLLPSSTQICTDGDPGCDHDGARNGVCTFNTQLCLRVPDARLPACTPASLQSVSIKQPTLPGGPNPLDQNNAQQLFDKLAALGGTIKVGDTVLQSGAPISASNLCTDTMAFEVAPGTSGLGKRAFNILAEDVNGLTMSSNLVHLWCAPNTSVCGNGVTEITEQCDDGNTVSCDGCSSDCKIEACGNGVVECNETCDDGPLNGTPGDHCSATCSEVPPDLRIPGGGAKATDCAFEWSLAIGQPTVDRKGVPKPVQDCTDNDPACDSDPTPGNCRFKVWGCVGAADPRISCSATQVTRSDVKAPNIHAKKPEDIAARDALVTGLQSLTFPAGPGEQCSNSIPVNVPAGKRRVVLRTLTRLASGKGDIDALRLRCLP